MLRYTKLAQKNLGAGRGRGRRIDVLANGRARPVVRVADQSVLASIVAPSRLDGYEQHRPEATVLCQASARHWPEFKSRMEEQEGLHRSVVGEFEHYLDCGFTAASDPAGLLASGPVVAVRLSWAPILAILGQDLATQGLVWYANARGG